MVWMRARKGEIGVMVVLEGSVGNIRMRERERKRKKVMRKIRKEGARRYCVTSYVEKVPCE